MFENRKEGRTSNSELSKIVKRRKEKIEKRIVKTEVEESCSEQIGTSTGEEPIKTE